MRCMNYSRALSVILELTTTGTEDHVVIPTSKEVKEQMSSLDIYVTCISAEDWDDNCISPDKQIYRLYSLHCSITEIAGLLDPDVVVREHR